MRIIRGVRLAALLYDIGKPDAYREENGEVSFRGHYKSSNIWTYENTWAI